MKRWLYMAIFWGVVILISWLDVVYSGSLDFA